jgi:hypothetical protein
MQNPLSRPLIAALILSAGAGLLSATSLMDPPTQDVVNTREVLKEWVDVERTLSAEQRDWAMGKELIQDRIELVQEEIDSLRSRIGEAQESIAAADIKRQELLDENESLKAASASLEAIVADLEARVIGLLAKLPPPIVERVSMLSARLPKAGAETKSSLGERFQNIVGILNEVNKFNGEIALFSEVRTLEDGSSAEVSAMYVGVGQAYYVTGDQKHAGLGTSSADGWIWKPINAAAVDIALAIAILENEQPADFVHLPIQID